MTPPKTPQPKTTPTTSPSFQQTRTTYTTEQSNDTDDLIRSHKRALRLLFKPKTKKRISGACTSNNSSSTQESSSQSQSHNDSILMRKLKRLKRRKIALQAELAELTFAEKETIFHQVQSLAQAAASLHPVPNAHHTSIQQHYHRPYLHIYDHGEARLIMSYTQAQRGEPQQQKQTFRQSSSTTSVPESIQNERKKRKLMGAHRLTGISVFNILKEDHHWYLGARIDITKNGGAFQLSGGDNGNSVSLPTVYYVFVELVEVQGVRRWKLKNHTFPHCLASCVSSITRDFYQQNRNRFNNIEGGDCDDPMQDLNCILSEIHGIVHAYHLRADSVETLRGVPQHHNEVPQHDQLITCEDISWNDAYTLVSFHLTFQDDSNEKDRGTIMRLKVKLRYTELANALPTNVSLDLVRTYKMASQGVRISSCDRQNPLLRELFADCAENLRTAALGEAVDAIRELICEKYARLHAVFRIE